MKYESELAHFAKVEPKIADLGAKYPPRAWETFDTPFQALVRNIVHQQVSMAAANSIHNKLMGIIGEATPRAMQQASDEQLRSAGLSIMKVSYMRSLTEHAHMLEELHNHDDATIIKELTQIRGIGVWSAKMFLMFYLERPNICAWEDLAIRLAVERFFGVPEKDAAAWLKAKEAAWSPYNSYANHVLWAALESN